VDPPLVLDRDVVPDRVVLTLATDRGPEPVRVHGVVDQPAFGRLRELQPLGVVVRDRSPDRAVHDAEIEHADRPVARLDAPDGHVRDRPVGPVGVNRVARAAALQTVARAVDGHVARRDRDAVAVTAREVLRQHVLARVVDRPARIDADRAVPRALCARDTGKRRGRPREQRHDHDADQQRATIARPAVTEIQKCAHQSLDRYRSGAYVIPGIG
jgi:predicted RNA-binding Zn ribbon-like protein